LSVSRVVIIGISAEREVRREAEADLSIDPLNSERRRSPLEEPELSSNRFADHPGRDPRRDRIQKLLAPPNTVGLVGLRRFRIANADAARLARPVNQIAVLVEHHRGAAQHRRPFPGECAEAGSLEEQILAPQILHDNLLRLRQSVPGVFPGTHDLGYDEVRVERNQ